MWGNLGVNVTGLVGAALENVQKISRELESQMDAAVADDPPSDAIMPGGDSADSQSSSISEVISPAVSTSNITDFGAESEGHDSTEAVEKIVVAKRKKRIAPKVGQIKKVTVVTKLPKETTISQDIEPEIDNREPTLPESNIEITTSSACLQITHEPSSTLSCNTESSIEDSIQINNDQNHVATIISPDDSIYKLEEEMVQKHKIQLEKLENEYSKKLSDEKNKSNVLLTNNIKEHELTLQNLQDKHLDELNKIRISIKEELQSSYASNHANEINKILLENSTRIDELKKEHSVEIQSWKDKLQQEIIQLQQLHISSMEEVLLEKERISSLNISNLNAIHESQIQELKRQLSIASQSTSTSTRQRESSDANVIADGSIEISSDIEQSKDHINDSNNNSNNDNNNNNNYNNNYNNDTNCQLLQESISTLELELNTVNKRFELLGIEMEQKDAEYSLKLKTFEEQYKEASTSIKTLEQKILEDSKNIQSLEEQLSSQSNILSSETNRLTEIITDRERALESVTAKMSELNKQCEDSQRKITDLTAEVKEKDSRLRQMQSMTVTENELRKQLLIIQETMKEKDLQLLAYDQEGQTLAKKQSEMEKSIRKSRNEIKEKENEINKLKESKEQLVRTIEEMQEVMRKNEGEVSNVAKNLSVMHAVSQASTDKLSKLEAEVNTKSEELVVQRKALEQAWTEAGEGKRLLAELRAERDDLRRQLGDGESKVNETESMRRDIEQREAVLRATNKQLQDSLQRQMTDSMQREERLRDELQEMRKRWQDTVISRESVSSEVAAATSPLLRQIGSLQDSLRIKSDNWQSIESTLTERMMRAESAAEKAEHRRNVAEEHVTDLKQQITSINARFHEAQESNQILQTNVDRNRRMENEYKETISDLENRLSHEQIQKQNVLSQIRDLENRYRLELQEARQAVDAAARQADLRIAQTRQEMEAMKTELEAVTDRGTKKKGIVKSKVKTMGMTTQMITATATSDGSLVLDDQSAVAVAAGVTDSLMSNKVKVSYSSSSAMPGALPSGELSYAASERRVLQYQQKEDEAVAVEFQKKQLQMARDALLEEVNYLSSKNSQLEEQLAMTPKILDSIEALKKQNEVLLTLLGEKEEELEACYTDIKEVKNMYKAQMEELLNQLTPKDDNI